MIRKCKAIRHEHATCVRAAGMDASAGFSRRALRRHETSRSRSACPDGEGAGQNPIEFAKTAMGSGSDGKECKKIRQHKIPLFRCGILSFSPDRPAMPKILQSRTTN